MQFLYPWHQDIWQNLTKNIDALSHANALISPQGFGKKKLALSLAKWLLCQDSNKTNRYCDSCKSCTWFNASTHPDFHFVEKQEDKRDISIEQIRIIIENVSQTAHQEGWKVVLIDDAQSMSRGASNALLKTLEEPTPKTMIILLINRLGSLPVTVLSRCHKVYLKDFPSNLLTAWLQEQGEYSKEDCEEALSLAENAPLYALHLLNSNSLKEYFSWLDDLTKLENQSLGVIAMVEKWKDKKQNNIHWLSHRLRKNIGNKKILWQLSFYEQWFALDKELNQAEKSWLQNLNGELVLQSIFTQWQNCAKKYPFINADG